MPHQSPGDKDPHTLLRSWASAAAAPPLKGQLTPVLTAACFLRGVGAGHPMPCARVRGPLAGWATKVWWSPASPVKAALPGRRGRGGDPGPGSAVGGPKRDIRAHQRGPRAGEAAAWWLSLSWGATSEPRVDLRGLPWRSLGWHSHPSQAKPSPGSVPDSTLRGAERFPPPHAKRPQEGSPRDRLCPSRPRVRALPAVLCWGSAPA